MRFVLTRAAASLAPAVGAVAGAMLASRHATAATVDRTTVAACASNMPASSARCATDRAVADVGPYVAPTLAGGAIGLVVAVVLVAVVAWVLRRRRAPHRRAAPTSAPSWIVLDGPWTTHEAWTAPARRDREPRSG